MNQETYQHIYEAISFALPENWKKVIFRADYTAGSYGMKFYVNDGSGKYTDCFSLPDVSKAQLVRAFMTADQFIAPIRSGLSDQEKWSVMTVTFDEKGSFKADFDYQDISETMVTYQQNWEKKYLV